MDWARISFKPAKLKSLVINRGKVVDSFRFNICRNSYPHHLGAWHNCGIMIPTEFLLQAEYDILPSPVNLHTWEKIVHRHAHCAQEYTQTHNEWLPKSLSRRDLSLMP